MRAFKEAFHYLSLLIPSACVACIQRDTSTVRPRVCVLDTTALFVSDAKPYAKPHACRVVRQHLRPATQHHIPFLGSGIQQRSTIYPSLESAGSVTTANIHICRVFLLPLAREEQKRSCMIPMLTERTRPALTCTRARNVWPHAGAEPRTQNTAQPIPD